MIERIEKMHIRNIMGVLNNDALIELCVDVAYHCGICDDHEVEEFQQEIGND